MLINGKEVDVQQLRCDWALALMSRGAIVKLTMQHWRARSNLTSEKLGLRFSDEDGAKFMQKYIDLGKYRLLPPAIISELDKVEKRAREVLKNYSFYTVWGYFVPFSAFDEWERANQEVRRSYMETAKQLAQRYDEIVKDVRADYRHLAKDAWVRLYPQDTGGATESFIENFVDTIVSQIPSATDILASFKYDTMYFTIPMPSFVEENISRARTIQRQREADDHQAHLEEDTRRRIADQYVSRKRELIDGFLESTVSSLRKYVSEFCESILDSMGKKKKTGQLTSHDVKKIREMMRRVKLLNFYDDGDVTKLLKDLDGEIDKFKGEVDGGAVTAKLREIVEIGTREFIPTDFNPAISYLEV